MCLAVKGCRDKTFISRGGGLLDGSIRRIDLLKFSCSLWAKTKQILLAKNWEMSVSTGNVLYWKKIWFSRQSNSFELDTFDISRSSTISRWWCRLWTQPVLYSLNAEYNTNNFGTNRDSKGILSPKGVAADLRKTF